ncbi:GAF and ANTAR domain-containing protein [Microbacterium sp. CPCC 204701]|uniref:GAF and ANTAR domain-containing protein n=1 Tax=Microbacterium sp. CPCC 204701 TaxID=2493084 RepID=UPI000FDB6F7B|nr:GAF and ANTAR domain-containing protein [Microbacterium sp. CPCC 204701]
MDDAFAAVMAVLGQAGSSDHLSESFLTLFPVDGASVSTLGDVLGTEIVSATGADARRLDELQFDLGEGPCWDALRHGAPISELDLSDGGMKRWPAFAAAASKKVPAASIYAFPVAVGSLRFGAVDLFARQRLTLSSDQTRQATAMADLIGSHLLREAIDRTKNPEAPDVSTRRIVHQATGVVLAQLDITAEEAQLVIQGHAFAAGATVMSIASDVVERRLEFRRIKGEIEAVR